MVRRLGYFAVRLTLQLRNRDTTRVEVTLYEANMLDTLRVIASPRLAAELQQAELRRRSGFGYFLGASEIRQRPNVRSLFDGIPSVRTEGASPYRFTILVRSSLGFQRAGYCHPRIYIDGFSADEEMLASLQPRSIVAVEVHPRQTADVFRYLGSMDNCGVVLVWTAAMH